MSQIASFKLCLREELENLQEMIAEDEAGVCEKLAEIESDDALDLSDGNCSGEVYTVLLEYLEVMKNLECRDSVDFEELVSFWTETRGPLDLVIFDLNTGTEILDVLPEDGEESLTDYLADDWDTMGSELVLSGIRALRGNLGLLDPEHCLVYLLN